MPFLGLPVREDVGTRWFRWKGSVSPIGTPGPPPPSAVAAPMVAEKARGGREEPTAEGCRTRVPWRSVQETHVGLLEKIFCQGRVPRHAREVGQERGSGCFEALLEGGGIHGGGPVQSRSSRFRSRRTRKAASRPPRMRATPVHAEIWLHCQRRSACPKASISFMRTPAARQSIAK